MDEALTVEEQLALIRKMIAEGRRRFADNGIIYIFIGILSVLAIAATYLVIYYWPGAAGPIIVWCAFGAAYWSTAKALEFPAMRPMAIGWAGGAILVCLVPVFYVGIAVAALVTAFQIVPGFAMRARYRRENGPAGAESHA
jgi:hypothetical protein